jgi:hypothetical protein
MAHAAGFHLDQHFVRGGLRLSDFFDTERLFEFAQDRGFHRMSLNEFCASEPTLGRPEAD